MTNFLAETKDVLAASGKVPADVRWVGVLKPSWSKEGDGPSAGTWDDFECLANFDYDSGYGGNEVASHLVIVGDDWWLERGEYDGSERWEFKTLPQKPAKADALRSSDLKER